MTYDVLMGTLNPTPSLYMIYYKQIRLLLLASVTQQTTATGFELYILSAPAFTPDLFSVFTIDI